MLDSRFQDLTEHLRHVEMLRLRGASSSRVRVHWKGQVRRLLEHVPWPRSKRDKIGHKPLNRSSGRIVAEDRNPT